jgi:hypothetical protein
MNPGFGVPIFDREEDVAQWLRDESCHFMAEHNYVWQSLTDSKTIDVLGRYTGMAMLPGHAQWFVRGDASPLVPRQKLGAEGRQTCDRFAAMLKALEKKLNA